MKETKNSKKQKAKQNKTNKDNAKKIMNRAKDVLVLAF